VQAHKGDECRRNEQLVGQRIEKDAGGSNRLASAREVSVELVGAHRQSEDADRPHVAMRQLGEQYSEEHGDEKDARDRDGVGNVHSTPW
jgi:hypothetical protein